ncbi:MULTISPECIES: PspA/IM30 family protein [Oceanobacillus]|uniref:PspA/IM30 family protein n=1 Tax=Oceanobacillus kimchii TaxID=746691 RepID=A0ABQ5TKZ3_9BACI|nr:MULTISPECIES: PspA/IM30 family protein [Oceanobacillus]MBT2600452.1 PspA/IM30 family protein [Oceanobacillus sp. ISL-74]MBT2650610.1 PspA/IM30 family protein [Oceanobacillus sp. ISL-73]MCT1578345.1 PspA/IM30 family protein [Oceanobacillus kimchii]MCT2134523.1 PspA/IM30 family protein [Oceanobacillus kimchii]OEH54850.1 modulator protein [Oceanobacillus sp. E9]
MATNIFTRIKDSVSADLHTMMDKKEQKNPIAALNHYLRQSEQEKEKVRKLIDRQYKLKEEFTREYMKAQDLADKRLKQAGVADRAQEEEMHEFALKEYEEYQGRADRMKASREEAMKQLEDLEQKYEEMKHRLKDMHLRRMELMGRENIAKANHQINRVVTDSAEKPYSKFEEMEQYIENLEYRVNSSYYQSTFDNKIAALEKKLEEKENEVK